MRLKRSKAKQKANAVRVGQIRPDGVQQTQLLTFHNVRVYEYGFTKACLVLCPSKWKLDYSDMWLKLLHAIIYMWSPNSYELRGIVQDQSLNIRLLAKRFDLLLKPRETCLKELWEKLHDVMLIEFPDTGEQMLTTPTDEQLRFCQEKEIQLEVP